jgi:hypothetical protein
MVPRAGIEPATRGFSIRDQIIYCGLETQPIRPYYDYKA